MEQLGISEEKYEQVMEDAAFSHMNRTSQEHSKRDPFMDGLDSSKDSADWRSVMDRSYESSKEKWENMREGRNTMNKSHKHGVHPEEGGKLGLIFFLALVCIGGGLFSLEVG